MIHFDCEFCPIPLLIVNDMENKWTNVHILFMTERKRDESYLRRFHSPASSPARRLRGRNAFYCETTSFGFSEVLPLFPWRKHKIVRRQPVMYPRSSLKFSHRQLSVPHGLIPRYFRTEKFSATGLIVANASKNEFYLFRMFERAVHLSRVRPRRGRERSPRACMDHY